ncbi:MAG TPA: YceI family protein [Armatimonadota bacterium]|jgi:polyisoprenoid-binding protein YceI
MRHGIRFAVLTGALAIGLGIAANWRGATTYAQTPVANTLQTTGTWTVDPMHTSVNFVIRHFGISLVHGRFDDFAGTIVANAEQPEKSSVKFTIQAASVDTNVKMRDDDLRSANYFDVAKFPTITFESTAVKKGKGGQFVAVGNLTIHGVTKEVSLPFRPVGPVKDTFGGTRAGLVTAIKLNRLDYGVGGVKLMDNGSLDIGKEVDVDISLEAVPAKPAATS